MVLGAMDLPSSSPKPTNTTKSTPQADIPTPPAHPTSKASSPFANGGGGGACFLKPLHHHHQPQQHHVTPHVTYRECLKNHAAAIGGHALDGCGEFMPSPAAVSADPTSLKCAACGCHRNFHRRDSPHTAHLQLHLHPSPPFPPPPSLPHRNSSPSPSSGRSSSPGPTPSPTPSPHSPPPVSHLPPNSFFAAPAPAAQARMLLALGGGFAAASDDHRRGLNPTGERSSGECSHARKRFRTKFSQEQKEKMCLFAEKLGWKMQRGEERLVEEFCSQIGVRKGVLKVWMHNNKHTLGKRDRALLAHNNGDHSMAAINGGGAGTNAVNGGRAQHDDEDDDDDDDEDDDDMGNEDDVNEKDHEDTKPSLNCFANGSSSSS